MEFNRNGLEDKFRRMATALQLRDTGEEAVVNYLKELNSKIGIPARLQEIGVREEHVETLAGLAFADFAHPNNPKPVSKNDFKQLYQRAL